jgi:hypothetical protein
MTVGGEWQGRGYRIVMEVFHVNVGEITGSGI